MKHMRLFPDAATRDSVLADVNYPVLHSTDGVGLGIKPGIDVPPGPDPTIPFYIENPTSTSVTTNIVKTGYDASSLTIEQSTDGETWTTLGTTSTSNLSITVPANSKVYLRCNTNNTSWATDYNNYNKINVGSSCNIGGNIMSLLYGSNFTGNETSFPTGSTYTFTYLFNGSNVVNAKDLLLPATTLANFCYQNMFNGCTGLTTAPELPATTLAKYCYADMFYGCTSLTTAPALPATTLADYCYYQMFLNCTSLTTAPALPATTLTSYCYSYMFSGCTGLTTAPALPAETSAAYCYNYMFSGCTKLATAPALPATTLAQYCYSYMFSGCTGLTTAPELPAETLVTSCYNYMFKDCTGLTTAPELPAETLATYCYMCMFSGCTSLNDVTIYADDISASGCLAIWLQNVAATGTFHNLGSASYTSGASGIPTGWTEVHS